MMRLAPKTGISKRILCTFNKSGMGPNRIQSSPPSSHEGLSMMKALFFGGALAGSITTFWALNWVPPIYRSYDISDTRLLKLHRACIVRFLG